MPNHYKLAVALSIMVMILSACKKPPNTRHVGRGFVSMAQCLDFIKKDVGESLKIITDTPSEVSGSTTKSRLFFICEAKMTGTRGLTLEGRWERLAK